MNGYFSIQAYGVVYIEIEDLFCLVNNIIMFIITGQSIANDLKKSISEGMHFCFLTPNDQNDILNFGFELKFMNFQKIQKRSNNVNN